MPPVERQYLEIPLAAPLEEGVDSKVLPKGAVESLVDAMHRPAGALVARPARGTMSDRLIGSAEGGLTGISGIYGSRDHLWVAGHAQPDIAEISALIPYRAPPDRDDTPWGDMSEEPFDGRRWFSLAPKGAEIQFETEGSVEWLCDFSATPLYLYFVTRGQAAGVERQFLSIYSRETGSRVFLQDLSSDLDAALPIRIAAHDPSTLATSEVQVVGHKVGASTTLRSYLYRVEHDEDSGQFTASAGVDVATLSTMGWDLRRLNESALLSYVVDNGTYYQIAIRQARSDGTWDSERTHTTTIETATYTADLAPHICSDFVENDEYYYYEIWWYDDEQDHIRGVRVRYIVAGGTTWNFYDSDFLVLDVSGYGFASSAEPTRIVGARTERGRVVAVENAHEGWVLTSAGRVFYGYTLASREFPRGATASDDNTAYKALCVFRRYDTRTFGGVTIRDSAVSIASVDGLDLVTVMSEGEASAFDLTPGNATASPEVAIPDVYPVSGEVGEDEVEFLVPFLVRTYANVEVSSTRSALRLSAIRVLRCVAGSPVARETALATGVVGGGSPVLVDTDVYPAALQSPTILVAEGAAGSLGAGTYGVAVVAVRATGRGDIVRSAPAFSDVTINASKKISVTVYRSLGVQDDSAIAFEVYATPTTDSSLFVYQKTIEPLSPTLDSSAVSLDATLASTGVQVYTAGGELANNYPPPTLSMALSGDRLFLLDASATTRVWPSKPKLPGLSWSWSALQPIDFPEPLTALASMDGRLIAFSEHSIFVVGGGGPDAAGYGAFSPVERLATPSMSGCVDTLSVVTTDVGVAFRSHRGYYLLSRSLQLQDIGSAVRDSTDVCRRALHVPGLQQVRFLQENNNALVYSYSDRHSGWAVWTYTSVIDAAVAHDGTVVAVFANGASFREDGSTDATRPAWSVTTGWVRLASLVGFARLHWLYLLGSTESAPTITISVYYDYVETVAETFTFTPAAVGTGELLRFKPARQKATAVKLKVAVGQASAVTAPLSLTGVGVQYLVKSKTPLGSTKTL